jgi:hypothetical protein
MQLYQNLTSKSRNASKALLKSPLLNKENQLKIKLRSKSSQRLFTQAPESFIRRRVINEREKQVEPLRVEPSDHFSISPIRKPSLSITSNEKSLTPKPYFKLPVLRKPYSNKNTSELLEIKSFRKYLTNQQRPVMCNAATNTSNDGDMIRENSKIDLACKGKAKNKKTITILDPFPAAGEKRLVDIKNELRIKQLRTKSSLK